jgi:hypothetical protein
MPNTDGYIHLEKQLKKGIWEEYVGDFEYRGRAPLSYDAFCRIWRDSFPHVKIRNYKQVSGTCQIWHNSLSDSLLYKIFCSLYCLYRQVLYLSDIGFFEKQISR